MALMFIEIGPGVRPALEIYRPVGTWILIEENEKQAEETKGFLFKKIQPFVTEISGLGYETRLPRIPEATITEIVMVNTFGQWVAPRRLFSSIHGLTPHQREREVLVPQCHRILVPNGLVTVVETDTPEDPAVIHQLFTETSLFRLSNIGTDVSQYSPKTSEAQYILQFTSSP